MIEGGALQKEFGSIHLLKPESGCAGLDIIQMDLVFPLLSKAAKYPLRWLPWVAAAVLKHSLADVHVDTTTFSDVNMTLPNVSHISQLTLPPDAWTSHNKDARNTNVSSLRARMTDGSLFDFSEKKHALPIAFVTEGPGKHSWHYDSNVASLLTVAKCPYTGLFDRHECKAPPYSPAETTPLPLPANPLIAEITAGSGASTGFAGSPTAYNAIAQKFEKWITKGIGKLSKPLWDKVIKCWPYGAQILSPPMVQPQTSVSHSEDDVPYRYMDGGYAENTGLPMTLAKIQRDCDAQRLDCSRPVQVMLVNDGNISADHNGPSCCQARDPLKSLFADPAAPVGTFVSGMFDTFMVPSQTIFAEAFPSVNEWRKYLSFPSKQKISNHWVEQDIESMTWSGIVTTVDNPHFGIRGGQKINLLVFSLQIPGIIFPGLGDAEQTKMVSPGHLRIADGAVMEDADLIAGHAPMARAQVEAMRPVLSTFLPAFADVII